ncbi:tyrosine-type recombinase/integrase [Bradyrhizobium sp. WYCCWR 13023]|uniref:Tyrosine-type recombinase/integrase n=1 Tax=Bradyrhizobium zhengyangense TaxID=2911009 RepID=A0A9X1UCH8_9BRAD|nr:tyrosine-type recombinase/integrase [Bradyrhizobium zhengyangense]MCG2633180.1 tyrosine-type recombinase/integrase [Bradyrhizobium zhengyangense]
MLDAARNLRRQKPSPLRRHIYVMLIGLLASTDQRISEALNLRLGDLLPYGVLHIRQTKFNKNRLVPMHPSVAEALQTYLEVRRRFAGMDDHVFLSVDAKPMSLRTAQTNFYVILRKADVGQNRSRRLRIHDLRHTFARACWSNPRCVVMTLRATSSLSPPIRSLRTSGIPTGIWKPPGPHGRYCRCC